MIRISTLIFIFEKRHLYFTDVLSGEQRWSLHREAVLDTLVSWTPSFETLHLRHISITHFPVSCFCISIACGLEVHHPGISLLLDLQLLLSCDDGG